MYDRAIARRASSKFANNKRLEFIRAYKIKKGCMDCGYNTHPAALQFDHRPGEEKIITLAMAHRKVGLERIKQEIAKCDVVCANCHAIRTFNRRQNIDV